MLLIMATGDIYFTLDGISIDTVSSTPFDLPNNSDVYKYKNKSGSFKIDPLILEDEIKRKPQKYLWSGWYYQINLSKKKILYTDYEEGYLYTEDYVESFDTINEIIYKHPRTKVYKCIVDKGKVINKIDVTKEFKC